MVLKTAQTLEYDLPFKNEEYFIMKAAYFAFYRSVQLQHFGKSRYWSQF